MPSNFKFPPSVEIKRAIAAAIRAGVEIGSIADPRAQNHHPSERRKSHLSLAPTTFGKSARAVTLRASDTQIKSLVLFEKNQRVSC